jgi:hypothetical protein
LNFEAIYHYLFFDSVVVLDVLLLDFEAYKKLI